MIYYVNPYHREGLPLCELVLLLAAYYPPCSDPVSLLGFEDTGPHAQVGAELHQRWTLQVRESLTAHWVTPSPKPSHPVTQACEGTASTFQMYPSLHFTTYPPSCRQQPSDGFLLLQSLSLPPPVCSPQSGQSSFQNAKLTMSGSCLKSFNGS